ncbi:MAG TPA: NfeD family protein [Sedimentisphaerales bacterium]|nr:NfeD family protein [Sedimentisphaerales bacterium]
MDVHMIVLAVFLFLAAGILIVAEIFIPSWGIITVCALGCLAGGIAIFFAQGGPVAGWIGLSVAVVMLPTLWITAYRILPRTGFGRHVMLTPPQCQEGGGIPDAERIKTLLGAYAVVVTPLRPVGICDFSGDRLECVAESGYVDKGKTVQVIRVVGTQLTVRVVDTV